VVCSSVLRARGLDDAVELHDGVVSLPDRAADRILHGRVGRVQLGDLGGRAGAYQFDISFDRLANLLRTHGNSRRI
jgi:hypothetical protein